MANIASISGVDVSGGTKSTTPTLDVSGGSFGAVTVTVTNHSSFSNPNYSCVVTGGGRTTVLDSDVQHTLDSGSDSVSAVMTLNDSDAVTGTRTITVKAQEFGDYVESDSATATFDVVYAQNQYLRIRGVTSTGQDTNARLAIEEIGFFTAANATGTQYPTTQMTSNTSETGIAVSAGHTYSSTYAPWKAVDNSLSSFWWALATTAANNWWQIEFEKTTYPTSPLIKSFRIRFDLQTDAQYFSLKGSNTGAFSGEETDYGLFPITEDATIIYG